MSGLLEVWLVVGFCFVFCFCLFLCYAKGYFSSLHIFYSVLLFVCCLLFLFCLFVFSSSSAIEKETISMFADTGLVTATAGMQTLTQKSAKQKVFCLVRTVMFQL